MLKEAGGIIPIKEISRITSFTVNDVIDTLNGMCMLKYWKGQHIICVTMKSIEDHIKTMECKRPKQTVDVACIKWEPSKKASKQIKK